MSDEAPIIVGFIVDDQFISSRWEPNTLTPSLAEARQEVAEMDDDVNPWAVYRLVKVDDEAGGTNP